MHKHLGGTVWHVGQVERIVLGKVERACACCNLSITCCGCKHSQEQLDTSCPHFFSTFRN